MTRGRLAAALTLAVLVSASGCSSDPVLRTSLPGRPSAVAVFGGLVWIADDEASVVRTIDAETGRSIEHPVAVPRNPVTMTAGSDAVWVGHAGGEITRIDGRTRRPRTIEAGGSVTGIVARDPLVWATDLATKSLVEIDTDVLEIRRVYRLSDGAIRVAAAGNVLWVTNAERTVTRVDPRSREVGPVVPTGLGPIGLASDGERVWVANSDDGTVTVIGTPRGRAIGRPIPVGRGPVAVAVADGSVWIANQDDRTLVRIDADSSRVIGDPIALEVNPRSIAAAEDAVWVVGTNPGRVVRVDL